MKKEKSIKAAIRDFEKTAADLEKLNQAMVEANAKKLEQARINEKMLNAASMAGYNREEVEKHFSIVIC